MTQILAMTIIKKDGIVKQKVTMYYVNTELFHVESVRGDDVQIFGYLPPTHNVKWYLSVSEDSSGIVERYPQFRPQQEVEVRSITNKECS